MRRLVLVLLTLMIALLAFSAPAASSDSSQDFAAANQALKRGAFTEAIDTLELLADRGFVHPDASFNRAADLMENQIRRHKERLLDRHGGAAADDRTTMNHPSRGEAPLAARDSSPADPGHALELYPAVIAEPSSGFREMTVSGAAMELDSTNAALVVFRRASDGRTNVVYRRPDGNIGWIDPGRE